MKAILQSCRECLDRLDGMIDCVHKETLRMEIIEVHARFTELLASCQSYAQVTIGDLGGLDSSVDIFSIGNDEPQTIMPVALNNLNTTPLLTPLDRSLLLQPLALCGQFSDNEYSPSLGFVRVVGSLPEPGSQLSQGTFATLAVFSKTLTVHNQAYCSATPPVSSATRMVHNLS